MATEGKVIPVKVAVRCRPLVEKEENEGCQTCLQFVPGESQLLVGKDKAFTFDFVFTPTSEQSTVYQEAVVPLVKGLFKGYNATVLAYGQTGSGKTHTMGGGYGVSLETDNDVVGVIPRVIRELFSGIKDVEDKFEFVVKVSYLELYKEDLLDLFIPPIKRDKEQVTIRDDVNGGIKLVGMTELEVKSFEETMKLLEEGSQGRTTGATAMNNQSSRSHAIFTIHLERKSKLDSHDYLKAKFHLVDLAGSERIKKTHAEGERLKEGININKGLLALGNVISALGEESVKRGHIPYRDSKLTRLLQDSLGGNSHTLMIACISPADSNMEETISTLRYADRARKIKNKPVINRDPQAAEILRLRQLVQELQCQGLALGKGPFSASGDNHQSLDYKALVERNRKLEEENHKLVNELQVAISQNTDMMEKVVRSELSRDKLKAQLQDLKQKTGLSITQMLNTTRPAVDDGEAQTSQTELLDHHISLMKEVQDKICEIETEEVDQIGGVAEDEDGTSVPDPLSEEMRNKHVLRQARLGRELQELNNMLQKKQELASQMVQNEEHLQEMRTQYETQMKDMEAEIDRLLKEKEEINQIMVSIKSNSNNKLAEQRRKRVQELEAQIAQLKKKMTEQLRLLKFKEQSEKQVEKLNQEIVTMKQQRVKLMNQIKDDAEQFRKMKAEMAKEVLQLKSQDRKRLAEIAKLERQHVNQQAVLRRKAEEAAAANNRLKEVLMRQKMVAEDRMKKQENADLSGIGARVRKILGDEYDFLVSVEEAKIHLNRQISVRKDMMEQIHQVKKKLEGEIGNKKKNMSVDMTDDEKQSLVKQSKELEQQIDLCNAQITDLQQKLIDADQDEKNKSRWDNIHTMVEAKCAMKWLLSTAVSSKVESDKKDSDIEDIKAAYEEATKSLEAAEEEHSKTKQLFEKELFALRKEQESKTLYLLNQLRNSGVQMSESERVEELRKRIAFQEDEIKKLCRLEEELQAMTKERNLLRKELTKLQYKMTLRCEGSLMPQNIDSLKQENENGSLLQSTSSLAEEESKFFSPAFFSRQTRKRTMGPLKNAPLRSKITESPEGSSSNDDTDNSDDDVDQDPDYQTGKGLTPGFQLPKTRSRVKTANESSLNRTFTREASQLMASSSTTSTLEDQTISEPPKPVVSRKRSSGNKKKTDNKSEAPEEQNKDPLTEGLNGFGKKRKLQPARGGYFNENIAL